MKSSKFIKFASGTGAKLILFLKFWCHIFAPTIAMPTECPNRSENLINRKLSIFYIETMYQLFFQLQPKNIFFRDQKYFSKKNQSKIFFGEIPKKKLKFEKFVRKSKFQIFFGIFTEKYFLLIFSKNIFDHEKKYFLVGVGKKVVT